MVAGGELGDRIPRGSVALLDDPYAVAQKLSAMAAIGVLEFL
jgi:hypothetical protein